MALNQREKILLTLPVLVGGVLAFYNWVHEPLFERRAQVREQSEQVTLELNRDKAKLAREGDLNARKTAVTTREQMIDSWVPGKNSAALFVWYLSQAEMHSGAKIRGITVGEKKEITSTPEQQGQAPAPTQAPAPAQAGQPQASGQPDPNQAGAPAQQTLATRLVVIPLTIKVDAKFASHMLFNQALEEMPLFLNTDAFTLERRESKDEDLGKLILDNKWLAAQVLASSPGVDGEYTVNLYFKGGKVGPTTDAMAFGMEAGRMDPFAVGNANEFIKAVTEAYATQQQESAPGQGRNGSNTGVGQMG